MATGLGSKLDIFLVDILDELAEVYWAHRACCESLYGLIGEELDFLQVAKSCNAAAKSELNVKVGNTVEFL